MSNEQDTVGVYIGFGSYRSVSSPAELDILLDDVTRYALAEDLAVAITLFYPDREDIDGSALHLGIGSDMSTLQYVDSPVRQHIPGVGDKPTLWWFNCDYDEVPAGREIPLEVARAAAREYVRLKGHQPVGFHWVDSDTATLAHAS